MYCRLVAIDEVVQQMCSEENSRARPQQEERHPARPAIPIRHLVSGAASRLVLRMSQVEMPSLSIGRASENVFKSYEDMPLAGLINIIDSEPKFKTNLINMIDLQLSFGRLVNSFGWCPTRIPIFTTQNSRYLYMQAANNESKNINRKMYWIEMDDLNKLSATIFLSKLVCEALPALILFAKLEYAVGDKRRSCSVLGELIPLLRNRGKVEDWHHLSQVEVIPVEGNMSLASIVRNMSASVDARLKNQIVSSLHLLAHWTDVTNKVSFVLKQMPPTTLSDLQKDIQNGLTEKDLQAKAFIDQVYVNEFCFLSVFVPRIIDINTASLVTLGETAQDA